MHFELIETNQHLAEYCEKIKSASVLAIDTEFVRTRTLLPKLGLIQVFDGEHLGLVDTVSISDFSPFADLLTQANIIKALHSCSEDIEAFWTNLNIIPTPIFDTQVAASLCNMGSSIGYANMIEKLQGIVVDKGESRTDWIARPLSKEQLAYAAADVFYLLPAFHELYDKLATQDKNQIVFSEIECLSNKKKAQVPSEYAYMSIKNAWKLRAHSRMALKLLAKWRLERARKKDIAINFVLKEQVMLAIAMKLPDHIAQLSSIDGFMARDIRQHGEHIINLIEQAKSLNEDECPERIRRLVDVKDYKKALGELKTICETISQKEDIPQENLASKKQLEQLLKWCWFDLDMTEQTGLTPDLLTGWRAPLFRPYVLNLFSNESGKYNAVRSL